MTSRRDRLDVYLRSVNEEIQTMKMSSELWFRSPPRHRIHENDRFVRSLISGGLGRPNSVPLVQFEPDPDLVWTAYRDATAQTRDIAVHFGAAGHRTLDEYFTLDSSRSGEVALARARRVVSACSPADYVLRGIDRLSTATGESPAQSCRRAMRMLSQEWPGLVGAHGGRSGAVPSAAHLLREFHQTVETRIAACREPRHITDADIPTAVLTPTEARELATVFMLSRYAFTGQEYRLAGSLVAMPRLRSALLAAHLQLTEEAREPLSRLVTEFGTTRVLLPFTEAFVNRFGYGSSARVDLVPNPKLITVLCNNVVPAIAGELLRRGAGAGGLDADLVRAGIATARRRRVFEIMVGLFNRAGGQHSDPVELTGFSMRVCPAAAPFSAFAEKWLPYHFNRFGAVVEDS